MLFYLEIKNDLVMLVESGETDEVLTKTPQNSSTESNVTTSLSRSFQLSP
jgi:hypothetical protein